MVYFSVCLIGIVASTMFGVCYSQRGFVVGLLLFLLLLGLQLLLGGSVWSFVLYVLASVILGIALVAFAYWIVR